MTDEIPPGDGEGPGAAASAAAFGKGFLQGVGEGIVSLGKGVYQAGEMTVDGWRQLGSLAKEMATDPETRGIAMQGMKDVARGAGEAGRHAAENPTDVLESGRDGVLAARKWVRDQARELWEAEKAGYAEASDRGEGARYMGRSIGRVGTEIASLFVGVGELSKMGKGAKAVSKIAKVDTAVMPCGKVASKANKALLKQPAMKAKPAPPKKPAARPAAAAAPGAIESVKRTVYRMDDRDPATIFQSGFQPRGTSTDLATYVKANTPSAFISTSKTPAIAQNQAFKKKYFYEIDGTKLKGVDVNRAIPNNIYAAEQEIAVLGGVPREAIVSARPMLPNGQLGTKISNPFYKAGP